MPSHTKHPRTRRWVRGTLACALTTLAAACAFPTEAPILEQHWNIPGESTTIGVEELLPSTITLVQGGQAFGVQVPAPLPVTRALYQDCAACAAADGATIAKPAFTAVATSTTRLPADLHEATLTGGVVRVTVTNRYTFDPMNPAPGVVGTVTVEVTNAGRTLGSATFDGTAWPFPAGTTRGIDVDMLGAVTGTEPVVITVKLTSPAGDPVLMTEAQHIFVEGAVAGVRAPSAIVSVTDREVSTTSEIDLSDIEKGMADRVDSAAVRLRITNPFAAGGVLTAVLEAPGLPPLTRTIPLTANATNATEVLRYKASEIRPFFGHQVTLRVSGPVAAAAPITVTPTQVVSIASRLDLFVALGR